ncbi:MAG: hypothetical protein IPM46_07030 [Flavobacteriales bacterium]|nr:hypothetical protein [Flavobacteriales bacterium]
MKYLVSLLPCAFALSASTQTTTWVNYVQQTSVRAIQSNDEAVWLGTHGGLVRIEVATSTRTFFNRSNSGLPDNQVNAIACDASGELWIGTAAGIAYHDGISWETYRTDNSGLLQPPVDQVAVGPAGEVWMHGGTGGTIQKLQGGSWLDVDPGVIGIQALAVDASGILWVATSMAGLLRFDGTNWTTFNTGNSAIPSNNIIRVTIAPSGTILLRCGVELVTFDGSVFTSYPIPVDPMYSSNVDQLTVAADGICYVTTSAYYYPQPNPTNVLFPRCLRLVGSVWDDLHHYGYPGFPEGPMGAIALDDTGTLWTGASRFYSLTNGIWAAEAYASNAPGQNSIGCLHAAPDGKVWAAGSYSTTNNRYVFDGVAWSEFNGGQLITVNDIITDPDGEPILATDIGVLWADGVAWNSFNTGNSPLPSNFIEKLFLDDDEALWVVPGNGGLLKYDGNWTTYTTANAPLSSNDVNSIAQDPIGVYWIGTGNGAAGGGGISRFDGTNWTTWTPANSSLPYNSFVPSIAIASDGTPWFLLDRTFEPDVVAWFDGNDFVQYHTFNSSLPQNMTCVVMGPSDVPFVGTPFDGLMYRPIGASDWSAFTISNSGIATKSVQDISLAPDGDLWIAAGTGGINRLTVDFFEAMDDVATGTSGLSIAPSIADASADVLLTLDATERVVLEVIDANGKVVRRSGTSTAPAGTLRRRIDTSMLANGSYTVVVIGSTVRTARLVVQH